LEVYALSNPWTNKVTRRFLARGFVCGRKIADILRERHPKAQVYPLYRSAVAIEYDSENKTVKIYAAGDPHAWGGDITPENVTEEVYLIVGNRFGPKVMVPPQQSL